MKAALNLPEGWVPIAILEAGYPNEDCAPSDNHARRRPIAETVFYNAVTTPAEDFE